MALNRATMILTKQVVEMSKYTSFIVYKHTSPSGKVYIGITQRTPNQRFQSNGYGYKSNEHFYRAIKKYGWNNFKHEILYSGLSKEIACKIEIELIAKHNSTDGKYGYNIATGGEHPMLSEETKKKLSEAMKGRVVSEEERKKMSDRMKGQILSEETRRKISEAKRGHIHSEETCRKLSEANKGRIHSEETRKKISEARKGQRPTEEMRRKNSEAHKGRIHSEEERRKISVSHGGHPVMCVETGIVYESIHDAERRTGISNANVSAACHGKRKTAGGLHWKYITKEE